jgi:hypothetical protein
MHNKESHKHFEIIKTTLKRKVKKGKMIDFSGKRVGRE